MAGVSEFVFETMVRGYHVYREIWTAAVGEELSCVRETGNYRDPFAVAVVKSGVTVGHVPKKISCTCSVFLRKGGTIDCRVTGARRRSEDLPQGGPCTLTLKGSAGDIEKVKLLVKRAVTSTPSQRADIENEPPRKKIKVGLPDSE